MASTTATWSPSSPQLRLALRCRNCKESGVVFVRARTGKLDCSSVRLLSVSRSRRKGLERRRNGALWIVSDSTAGSDTFSGWSDSDTLEDSVDSKSNGWFGGIMGAGSAGLVLVAGLSFAAMSLSNRSTSRPKQQLQPLTTQQEVSLASDNESDKIEENEISAALQVHPGKVLVPAVVDQVQGQALAALQVLKVIEADVQPSDLCTRREYARWLVSASSALSRNTASKVYPAMYIENVTELAFDDITPDDPDFSSIQGLAEAGLISSKFSNQDLLNDDLGPFYFFPESPLSRQDLVSWKMALEKRQLPEADRKILYQLSGFIDINKINPDAWPALMADLSSGEQGIIALAFGCVRLFQPDKPVTKAQAAVALATGEASDLVSEEFARIEAESMAENAVSAHTALVAQVEKDVNASFEKELLMEREKIDAVEKMAEEAKRELERLRSQREEENIALMKDRAAIDSEMEVLSRLRREVEEQLESLMRNKVEIQYEKERISKLLKETENESQEIVRLQHELEVERKALSMARAWAEDEARRASEQAKALEEARDRWERHGIKVVVDNDLREESVARSTWVNVGKQVAVEGTISRGEILVGKLKVLASQVKGKSREFINKIVERVQHLIAVLKEWTSTAGAKAEELTDKAILKASGSVQELQQSTAGFSSALKEGAKRVAGDCREGVEKLTQRFRT
ncbi:Chloroplast thylakoid membrane, putative isoform 4 [Theobroma cacao]|uniref:Chloroplast thylakoid membrane, putative isoform 4 n=1 Tax=Theobroma cacao TaxID=3641 RepID=A0A061G877_THECC|nr:Chloroplast thylakoid membrane, putative isoform 4 [Theobroma cacao]